MGRRQVPHPTRSMPGSPDASAGSPPEEWTRWRPRPKPIFLALSLVLLVVWVGFLFAMISLK